MSPLAKLFLFAIAVLDVNRGDNTAWSSPHTVVNGRIIDALETPKFSSHSWGDVPASWLERNESPQKEGSIAPAYFSADLNGDGYSDLLFANTRNGVLPVLENNQKEGFHQRLVSLPNSSLRILGAKDVNSDGCDDVFFHSPEKNEFLVASSDCQFGLKLAPGTSIGNVFVPPQRPYTTQATLDPTGNTNFVLSDFPIGQTFTKKNAVGFVRYDGVFPRGFYNKDKQAPLKVITLDANGDGILELLSSYEPHFNIWFLTKEDGKSPPFVILPDLFLDTSALPIDLNNDGREDLLLWSEHSPHMGWFAALSKGNYAIEFSVPGVFQSSVEKHGIVVGDFNADGMKDLFSLTKQDGSSQSSKRTTALALRASPQGIPHVHITTQNSSNHWESDERGYFSIPQTGNMPPQLFFQKAGHAFASPLKTFDSKARRLMVIAGEDLERRNGEIGRSLGLLGDPPGPYLCLGYTPLQDTPDQLPVAYDYVDYTPWMQTTRSCPKHYAMYSTTKVLREKSGHLSRAIKGNCCRLPSTDIVTSETIIAQDVCPANSIITGFVRGNDRTPLHSLQCTFINTQRYQLQSGIHATYWGFSLAMRGESGRLRKNQLPLALRYGTSRTFWSTWEDYGCIAGIFGGLFTDLIGTSCREHGAARLEYRGIPGDPPQGTPVQMFPDCKLIKDQLNPFSGCIAGALSSKETS